MARLLLTAAAIVLTATVTDAQEPATAFDRLDTVLGVGDRVTVTDVQGREFRGAIQRITTEALTLEGAPAFEARTIALIGRRDHDPVKNGALVGLAIGGGLAAVWCVAAAIDEDPEVSARVECGEGAAVYGGLGALLGLAIDAAIPGRMRIVYRGPKSAAVSFTF